MVRICKFMSCVSIKFQTCYSGEQLLDIFGVDHDSGITEAQFNSMAPSLLQQIISGVCALTEETASTEPLSDAEGRIEYILFYFK